MGGTGGAKTNGNSRARLGENASTSILTGRGGADHKNNKMSMSQSLKMLNTASNFKQAFSKK